LQTGRGQSATAHASISSANNTHHHHHHQQQQQQQQVVWTGDESTGAQSAEETRSLGAPLKLPDVSLKLRSQFFPLLLQQIIMPSVL